MLPCWLGVAVRWAPSVVSVTPGAGKASFPAPPAPPNMPPIPPPNCLCICEMFRKASGSVIMRLKPGSCIICRTCGPMSRSIGF